MPVIRLDSEGNKPNEAKHLHLYHYSGKKTYNSLLNLEYNLTPTLESKLQHLVVVVCSQC